VPPYGKDSVFALYAYTLVTANVHAELYELETDGITQWPVLGTAAG